MNSETFSTDRCALDNSDRAAFDRAAKDNGCKLVGPDIRLTVVARPARTTRTWR